METTLECSFFHVDEDCKNPTIVTVKLVVAPKTAGGKIELRKLDWCFDYLADGTRAKSNIVLEPKQPPSSQHGAERHSEQLYEAKAIMCGHTALEMMGDERE